MANPQIAQGTLNRLKASVGITDAPELNVTASFLGREGISISLSGDSVARIPTLVGTVNSPEPFVPASVVITLLKTQGLSDAYKKRMESNAVIGDITIYPDTTTLSPYNFSNCSIMSVHDLPLNGSTPNFAVVLGGFYPINSALFSG